MTLGDGQSVCLEVGCESDDRKDFVGGVGLGWVGRLALVLFWVTRAVKKLICFGIIAYTRFTSATLIISNKSICLCMVFRIHIYMTRVHTEETWEYMQL